MVPEEKIYGFAGSKRGAEEVVYLRNLFEEKDDPAFQLVLGALSSLYRS